MAFAAGLRVIERSEAIAYLLEFLEFRLIGQMGRIIGDAVAFVVKTGRGFGRTGGRRGDKTKEKTQDRQRDQEPHGLFPLFWDGLATGALSEGLIPHFQRSGGSVFPGCI